MMRIASASLFLSASLVLALAAFLGGIPSIGYGAVALGGLSVIATLFPTHRRLVDVLLVAHAGICSVAAVFRLPTLAAVTVMALAVTAWDAARVSRRIAHAEPVELRRFTIRYLSRAFVVPGLGIALVTLAASLPLDLSFGPAIGLSIGGLLIAALLLRLLRSGGRKTE